MKLKRLNKVFIFWAIIICFLTGLSGLFVMPERVWAETATYDELITKAIQFNREAYASGETLNAYDAYVLTLAGEDVSAPEWVYEGASLKQSVIDSVYATLQNPDAVPAKEIAYQLLAVQQWGYEELAGQLARILADRQGQNGFDNNIYSDMPALDALGLAGYTSVIDAVYARDYILRNQCVTTGAVFGSWGTQWGDTYYPDFMTTAQAIRALKRLPEEVSEQEAVQEAVYNGLNWMQGQQQADGGFAVSGWDDPLIDTAEVVTTLKVLGIDPSSWKSGEGKSPVDYIVEKALNPDGSFGSVGNVMDATWTMYACLLLREEVPVMELPAPDDTSPSPGGTVETCTVGIAVVGRNGELLYGPEYVEVSEDSQWGLTALGALDATGLPYTMSTMWEGFVESIAGQANEGMSGWMYKVNDRMPVVSAKDYAIESGDEIIWWYSTDMSSTGPKWEDLAGLSPGSEVLPGLQENAVITADLREQVKNLSEPLQASAEAITALENIHQLLDLEKRAGQLGALDEVTRAVIIVGGDKPLGIAERLALKKELASNRVELAQKVTADKGALITDSRAEMALFVPAGALASDVSIAVKEAGASNLKTTAPAGYRQISPVYDFGPEGTAFDIPVTLCLRVALPPLTQPENVTFALHDGTKDRWVAVPAVIDVSKGIILAQLKHFSQFAVFAREVRKPFVDVSSDSFGWARDAVETLAGAGIVTGTDGIHFEPTRPVTRAEFVALLVRALDMEKRVDTKTTFKDIRAGDWYAAVVSSAAKAGLVEGYGDGTFRPNNTVTREEVAAMLVRVMDASPAEHRLAFKDSAKVSLWAKNSVAEAVARGLIKGYPDGTFRPKNTASRAETAVMVYRLIMREW